jgi:hypothetical protein
LGVAPAADGVEACASVVEPVADDEVLFVSRVVEACGDRLGEALVDGADRVDPRAHVQPAKLDAASDDRRMSGDWLRVD